MRLDIKRKLTARSDRVKCVDLHLKEPWMLASLYNGNVHIWNHETATLIKSYEVSQPTLDLLHKISVCLILTEALEWMVYYQCLNLKNYLRGDLNMLLFSYSDIEFFLVSLFNYNLDNK